VGVSGSEFELLIRSGLWALLSPTERTLLQVLHAFRDPNTGLTTISYRGLMRYGGVGSPASTSRSIRHLSALHALAVERKRGSGVVSACSSYRLTLDDDRFIRLLNDVCRRHRAEVETERSFRAGLRASREKAVRHAENLLQQMPRTAPPPGSIFLLDSLDQNRLERQTQDKSLSCTGLLLCSPSEVPANKSVHLVKRGKEESQKAGT
jgi:hypothetical protein